MLALWYHCLLSQQPYQFSVSRVTWQDCRGQWRRRHRSKAEYVILRVIHMSVIRYHFVSLHQGTLQNSLISPPGQTVLIWYVVSFFFLEVKNCRSDNSCSCFSPHIVGLRDLLFFFFCPRLCSQRMPPGQPWPRSSAWSTEGSWSERPAATCLTSPWCPSSCSLGLTPAPWLWSSSRQAASSPPQWVTAPRQ